MIKKIKQIFYHMLFFIPWYIRHNNPRAILYHPMVFYKNKNFQRKTHLYLIATLVQLLLFLPIIIVFEDIGRPLMGIFLLPLATTIWYIVTTWEKQPLASIFMGGFNLLVFLPPVYFFLRHLIDQL